MFSLELEVAIMYFLMDAFAMVAVFEEVRIIVISLQLIYIVGSSITCQLWKTTN